MKRFVTLVLSAAPRVLLAMAIINIVAGLFATFGSLADPVVAVAASLNAGLVCFIAAAVNFRADTYLEAISGNKKSDPNA